MTEWQFIIALTAAVPIVMVPVVFIWYLNVGAMRAAVRDHRARRDRGDNNHRG